MKKSKKLLAIMLATAMTCTSLSMQSIGTVTEVEAAEADANGFVIEDGVLTKYTGTATDVVIPEGVTKISYQAFYHKSSIVTVTIPEGVTSIGDYAFNGCDNLVEVNLPNSLTTIGIGAFSWCSSIKRIELPTGLTTIKKGAFERCNQLNVIVVPESVETIEDEVFPTENKFRVIGKKDSYVETYVKNISNCTFTDIENVKNDFIIEDGVLIDYIGTETELVIPDGVKEIKEDCLSFYNDRVGGGISYNSEDIRTKITSITIPGSVKKLEGYFGYGLPSLKKVVISEGTTDITGNVFWECNLRSITIPESVTNITAPFWNTVYIIKKYSYAESYLYNTYA